MEQITVEELYELCKQEMENGNGKKYIVITDDNDGNGMHGLFTGFTEMEDYWSDCIKDSNYRGADDTIILG